MPSQAPERKQPIPSCNASMRITNAALGPGVLGAPLGHGQDKLHACANGNAMHAVACQSPRVCR
eukprot:1787583-Lingulodinium_polyedra.AAC.1